MNALEILGLACVDATFRKQMFENVQVVIAANRTDLTWAEEEGLRRITGKHRPARTAGTATAMAMSADAKGSEGDNSLEEDLAKVGADISMMCPTVPCAWPDSFTQNK